jgi:hypothetical protein
MGAGLPDVALCPPHVVRSDGLDVVVAPVLCTCNLRYREGVRVGG